MRLLFTALVFVFFTSSSVAQEVEIGKKYYYNFQWDSTTNVEHAKYYRFYESYNGIGWPVSDYYISGCLQFQGVVKNPSFSKGSCDLEKCTGPFFYFYENGNIQTEGNYKNGKPVFTLTSYCINGKIEYVSTYSQTGKFISNKQYNSPCNNNGVRNECSGDKFKKSETSDLSVRISSLTNNISKVAVIGKESTLCDGSKDDGQSIAELVEGELLGIYGVVERKHLEEILDEQRLAMSGFLLEDSDFAQAGCLAGAQGTVLASYGCLQGQTKLQIKLVDCSTSDLYWSATGFDVSEFDLLDALRVELSK